MGQPSEINKCFSIVLRELRRDAGLSQEQLALQASLDRTFISLLERGLRQPSLKSIFALSNTLSIKPHEMVKRVETHMYQSGGSGSNG